MNSGNVYEKSENQTHNANIHMNVYSKRQIRYENETMFM